MPKQSVQSRSVPFSTVLSTNSDRSCCLVMSCPATFGYTIGYRCRRLLRERTNGCRRAHTVPQRRSYRCGLDDARTTRDGDIEALLEEWQENLALRVAGEAQVLDVEVDKLHDGKVEVATASHTPRSSPAATPSATPQAPQLRLNGGYRSVTSRNA